MGTQYSTLSLEERMQIERLCAQKLSCREIARRLNRAPSTITRELARNLESKQSVEQYRAANAARNYTQRRSEAKAPVRKLGVHFDSPRSQIWVEKS